MTCAFCYFERDGEVLMVQHAYGSQSWHIPGGDVKEGELEDVAALREFEEETGYMGLIEQKCGVIDTPGEDVAHIYKVKVVGGSMRLTFDREIRDIGFFPLDRLPSRTSRYALERIDLCRRMNG